MELWEERGKIKIKGHFKEGSGEKKKTSGWSQMKNFSCGRKISDEDFKEKFYDHLI